MIMWWISTWVQMQIKWIWYQTLNMNKLNQNKILKINLKIKLLQISKLKAINKLIENRIIAHCYYWDIMKKRDLEIIPKDRIDCIEIFHEYFPKNTPHQWNQELTLFMRHSLKLNIKWMLHQLNDCKESWK